MKVQYPIVAEKTAMLVIDMQNQFVEEGALLEMPPARELAPRLNRFLELCRTHKILVIYVYHVLRGGAIDAGRFADHFEVVRNSQVSIVGTRNIEIYEGVKPQSGDLFVGKPRYSAFYGTDLEAILRSRGIDTVIIGGIATSACCESTARDAFSHDYKVIFLSDGTANGGRGRDMGFGYVTAEEMQRHTLTILASNFAQVASLAQVTAEIEQLPAPVAV